MNSASAGSKHYGINVIKKSLVHFVFGKGFSAISTLIIFFLTVRKLSVREFAVYTSLTAIILVISLVSSFGIPQVLNRYLADLRTKNNNRAMYRLLVWGSILRAVFYAIIVLALLPAVNFISNIFKLGEMTWLVPWYFVVGFLRVNATSMSQALENLLWQRESQYSLAAGGLIKLIGIVIVIIASNLTLPRFIAIECVGELASLLLLISYMWKRWSRDEDRDIGETESLTLDRSRFISYGFWCYLQTLTSVLYGSAPNRLFVAYFMAPEQVAIFGVVDRLVDFVRRYEPFTLFVGLIRPVFMSRYSRDNDFNKLNMTANFIFRINLMILILPLILLAVAREPLFYWMTAGKYGNAMALFFGFYVIALVTSFGNMLDILVKALEQNRIYMISNMVLSASIAIAVPLIPYMALWSIVVANMVGLLISLTIILNYLKERGYPYAFEWGLTSIVILYSLMSVATGYLMLWVGMPISLATIMACILYAIVILVMPPLRDEERKSVVKFMPERFRNP